MTPRACVMVLCLPAVFSCATAPSGDALEVLRKIELSLLQTAGLAVEVPGDAARFTFTRLNAHGFRPLEVRREGYVVRRGMLHWTIEDDAGDVHDIRFSGAGSLDDPGRILLVALRPWGVVNPFLREVPEEHILSTSLLTTNLADVRPGLDADGPFLVCRFRVELMAYTLPEEFWNRTIIGGIDLGPPRPMTGTTEQTLWYDPQTFVLRKRAITGDFVLDGGKRHAFEPVTEVYKPLTPGGPK